MITQYAIRWDMFKIVNIFKIKELYFYLYFTFIRGKAVHKIYFMQTKQDINWS